MRAVAIPKKGTGGRHLGLKLISIALAVLLELYFYSPDNSVTLMVPATIEIRNLPPSTIVVDPPRGEKGISALIEVRGPRPLVEQLRNSFNKLTIDYPAQAPEQFTAMIDPNQLQLPSGVEALSISPSSVKIRTEPVVGKQVMIIVDKTGKPAAGYELSKIEVFPETVVARGPQKLIEEMRQIETRPFDLSGLDRPTRRELSLKPTSPLITTGVTMVTVNADIRPGGEEQTIEGLQINVLTPPGTGATVEPSRAAVVMRGSKEALARANRESIHVRADGRHLTEGNHTLAVNAELPEGVELVKTVPDTVRVTVVGK